MRLIDADATIKRIPYEEIVSRYVVVDAPTIDAIPVIRCKDCKYKNSDIYKNAYTCDRFKGNVFVVDDDYCSYAERRSDETD